ncbi:MAG: hypothetical protein IJ100_03190 [Lachnospiraceae bacterium]|nr:hypothetical protein [Lachnospiraceae bacterium]
MYTFHRDSDSPVVWNHILNNLKEELADVKLGILGQEDLEQFCQRAIQDALPIDTKNGFLFWGFDEPKKMESDIRCQYFYLPTYLMTLILVNAVLQYPRLMTLKGMPETLSGALAGCTGRNLHGHGYDDTREQHRNLRLFLKGNILAFLDEYPEIGETFRNMLNNIMGSMQDCYDRGEHISNYERDFKKEQEELLGLWARLVKGNE